MDARPVCTTPQPKVDDKLASCRKRGSSSVLDKMLQDRGQLMLITEFPDATEEEERALPKIIAAFIVYLQNTGLQETSQKSYARAIRDLFSYDWKPAEIMASEDYVQFVHHTLEDCICNHIHSAALKHFAKFWEENGDKEFAESPLPLDIPAPVRKTRLTTAAHGDGSAEARAKLDLPEGWRVHEKGNEEKRSVFGCSSPNGRLYRGRHEWDVRLDRFTPQKASRPHNSAPMTGYRSIFEFMRPKVETETEGGKTETRGEALLPCVDDEGGVWV